MHFRSRWATGSLLATSLSKVEDPHWATRACWEIKLAIEEAENGHHPLIAIRVHANAVKPKIPKTHIELVDSNPEKGCITV